MQPCRILVLSRLFSGLKAGLASGQWEPRGVPAIYRLLEGLAADPDIELKTVFTSKDDDSRFRRKLHQTIKPIGETWVLPRRAWSGGWLRRLDTLLSEIEQTLWILFFVLRYRPNLIYASYANIIPAGLLARFGSAPVILRLLGVVPQHRQIHAGRHPVYGWLLRAPFAHVVSTQDGSDPAVLLPGLLHEDTPWSVRINGCDAKPLDEKAKKAFRKAAGWGERPVIAFLGRLEPEKGCIVFAKAVAKLLKRRPNSANVVIVGDGPLRGEMETLFAEGDQMDHVTFTGALPHEDAYRHVAAADIYVSTNMYGNLSNANLEAFSAGLCVVMPTSDPDIPLDTATDELIPADVTLRYDRNRMPRSLTDALQNLLDAPEKVTKRRERTRALARTLIRPWSECVVSDIDLLKSLRAQDRSSALSAAS